MHNVSWVLFLLLVQLMWFAVHTLTIKSKLPKHGIPYSLNGTKKLFPLRHWFLTV